MPNDKSEVIVGSALVLLFLCIGFFCAWFAKDSAWREDAISRGLAEYNQVNGEWQWKEEYPRKQKGVDMKARP